MTYDVARTLRSALLWRAAALLLGAAFIAAIPVFVTPAQFGIFNLVFSAAQVLASALLLWPNQGFLRQAREELHETGATAGSLAARLALHTVLAIVFVCLALIAAREIGDWLQIEWTWVAVALVAVALTQSTAEIGTLAMQARGRFETFNRAPIFQRLGQLAGLAAIIASAALESPIEAWSLLVAGTVVGHVASGINAWIRVPFTLGWRDAGKRVRLILGHSWTLPATSMAAFLLAWMDIWVIKAWLGVEAAGVYSFAYIATTLATAMLAPIVATLLPRSIDRHIARDTAGSSLAHQRIVAAVLLAGAFGPLLVAATATALVLIPLGGYAAARLPLALLVAAAVFQLSMALGETIVYAHGGLVRRYTLVVAGMVVVNLGLDVVLVPRIGIEGAALATAAAYAFGMLAQWRLLALPGSRLELVAFTGAGLATALVATSGLASATLALGLFATCALLWAGKARGRFSAIELLLPGLRRGEPALPTEKS